MNLRASSLKKLEGIHHDLHRVVLRATEFAPFEFIVTEGLRTKERQAILVKSGASKTLNSRHLTGHAIDVSPIIDNDVRWDWPLFFDLADAFQKAAKNLVTPLEWGGCWSRIDNVSVPVQTLHARYVHHSHENRKRPFMDGPHYQLPFDIYK